MGPAHGDGDAGRFGGVPPESRDVQEAKNDDNGRMTFARPEDDPPVFRISFVCTGNICRSPMAEAIFRSIVAAKGYSKSIVVTSAATGDWHVGESADPRTLAALDSHGYDGTRHRARQFDPAWFPGLDLVIAFDRGHERVLREWARTESDQSKVQLLMSFDPEQSGTMDVPDPYYSDAAMFDTVLLAIERACTALFRQLEPAIQQGVS